MGKKKNKKQTQRDDSWIVSWCADHEDVLANFLGLVVTVHPEFGIVSAAPDRTKAIILRHYLRRSIARVSHTLNVDATLDELGWFDRTINAEQPVPESQDPPEPLVPVNESFDSTVLLDGSHDPRSETPLALDGWPIVDGISMKPSGSFSDPVGVTVQQYANKHKLRATEVLMKLISRGTGGCTINSTLTEEEISMLDRELSPFPSPDKQPPYTPRRELSHPVGRCGLRFD
jgi:hypothetical protein